MPDYFDLGTYTRPVTASAAEAQIWFSRGLVWAYGFNHGEAARCFERATEASTARKRHSLLRANAARLNSFLSSI